MVEHQLQNVTVLVAEEDPLLADDLLNILQDEGATVAGPVFSVESALELLNDVKPDCAILNAGVAYETAMRLSKRLNILGIRYITRSGHSEQRLPVDLKGSHFISKPNERRQLIESVVATLADRR